jgi:hypothetical protein
MTRHTCRIVDATRVLPVHVIMLVILSSTILHVCRVIRVSYIVINNLTRMLPVHVIRLVILSSTIQNITTIMTCTGNARVGL